jgi:CHAT domain-containing protein/tetratricopeptide (TPR) repeat protein
MAHERHPLASLHGLEASAVVAALGIDTHTDGNAIALLAQAALEEAEQDTIQAAIWIAAAEILRTDTPTLGAEAGLLAYARARLDVHRGNLGAAEESLRAARALWQGSGDAAGAARSLLGLTQVLAMQGRYAEAEESVRLALIEFDDGVRAGEPEAQFHAVGAHHNLATILVLQDRHAPALEEYELARRLLAAIETSAPDMESTLRAEAAHNALNRASALTYLDRAEEAQDALGQAISGFDVLGDVVNRGRARTNLGRLHLRLGEYALALAEFDFAAADLLGVSYSGWPFADEVDEEHLQRADELLLEHGYAYLALNLLPEAEIALTRAERLFRGAEQSYELGQALYALGLVRMRGLAHAAAAPLDEALSLFETLGNAYWRVRTTVVRATLDVLLGDGVRAADRLDALPTDDTTGDGALQWDVQSRAEALLLRAQLFLEQGDTASAQQFTLRAANVTRTPVVPGAAAALPHWAARVSHMLGRIDRSRGDRAGARRWFTAAVGIVDGLRSTLPLEEVRTAFLADKTEVYADLVLALLDEPLATPADVRAAFEVIEHSRSRALLEQLISVVEDAQPTETTGLEEARRRLHSLYNQILGEQGSRGLDAEMTRILLQEESRVQRLEWQRAAHYNLATPTTLQEFQSVLADDQQAIVYAMAGAEVMAFVVSAHSVHLERHLCLADQLAAGTAELRFQLGRGALGADFIARHARRLEEGLRAALQQIYDLVMRPLEKRLVCERLIVIPSGPLHATPIHALWDGSHHLVERFEIAIAPSATLTVRLARDSSKPLRSWAGLALTDASIPSARTEVECAAGFFATPRLFLDEDASRLGLQEAAKSDILHIATHGLYRGDNPFFSVLKLADGWIDVRELYRLRLTASLVVLSACESGAGALHPGDEVIGLARGFLGAGARSLVAGAWHVHDDSAARLMERFYAALTGDPAASRPAAALRVAQRQAIDEGQHPYLWGAFYILGE